MSRPKIGNEWWTAPTESEGGQLIMVTGRSGVEPLIASGKYNDRIEVTWKYAPDPTGMPDVGTSKTMEQVTEAFHTVTAKDSGVVMTGIYTGAGERNWVFYAISTQKFQSLLNKALADFEELLPITIYAERDPEWAEYREMKDCTEILRNED